MRIHHPKTKEKKQAEEPIVMTTLNNTSQKAEKVYPAFLSPLLCFLSLVSLDFLFRTIYFWAGNTAIFAWAPVIFTVCWAALFTCIAALLPCLLRRIFMMIVVAFYSLLALVHGAMYKIFGNFFTFSDMHFAGDGARFFSWNYLNLNIWLILTVVLALALMVLACIFTNKKTYGQRKLLRVIILAVVIADAIVGIYLEHDNCMPNDDHMSWDKVYDPNVDPEVYASFSDSNRCLMMTGLYQYTFRNLWISQGMDTDGIDVSYLNKFYESRKEEISGDNEMTDSMEGKNLIMIMMESMDTWLITEDYTPNLYKLQQSGVNFENFYTPLFLSAGTFNTEIISQTGLIPANNGLSSSAYSTHAFPLSLANQFRDLGYTAKSFHSASGKIYSRGTVHLNLGFESYNNLDEIGMDDYMLDTELMNGYDLMVSDDPFFSFIITYSGHGPYTDDMSNISDPHLAAAKKAVAASGMTGSDDNMEQYTLAVAHAMETDQFVGELMDQLEEDDLLEDTVVLFYADHYGKYMTDEAFLMKAKGIEGHAEKLYNTPCFMVGGELEKETVDKYCSSLDLVPTIVNMFGLPANRAYYVGDDIFGKEGGVVILPNNNWYDGETYYSSKYSGELTEEIQETCSEVKEKSDASMDTLRSNYFNSRSYLNSEDAQTNAGSEKSEKMTGKKQEEEDSSELTADPPSRAEEEESD